MTTTTITNSEQYRILLAYAQGTNMQAIAKQDKLELDYVTSVISRLCGLNRQHAKQLVTDYQRPKQAAIAEAVKPLVQLPPPAPVKAPFAPPPSVPRSTIEELLAKAEASEYARISGLAAKIRALLDDLGTRLAEVEAEDQARAEAAAARAAARARVAELEALLAEARAALNPQRAKPPASTTPPAVRGDGVSTSTIRAWAMTAGVQCNAQGILPRRVVEAYHTAHPEAPR